VVPISTRELGSPSTYIELADLAGWEREFPGGDKGGSFNKNMAMNWLQRLAAARGIYDPTNVRGRGAWTDDGRCVVHLGDRLIVDGAEMKVHEIKSKYCYEAGRRMEGPAVEALSDEDGKKIVAVAEKFRWTRPGSHLLLAGWVALAPVCGALKWRPHEWLTGSSGCGKTSIKNRYVKFLMSGVCLNAQGNSTEAGIRNSLKSDALPVIFDESEKQNTKDEARVQAIIALARQASSDDDARTLKGTPNGDGMGFLIRSMVCFASIQVGLKYDADKNRITCLHLKKGRNAAAFAEWPKIDAAMKSLEADKTMPARLLRRTINLLPITLQNIRTFSEVASRRFSDPRFGDQYGTLLAGAWSLISSRLATAGEAEAFVDQYDWTHFLEDSTGDGGDEPDRAINAILQSRVRLPNGQQLTISDLIAAAHGKPNKGAPQVNVEGASHELKMCGIRVVPEKNGEPASLLIEVGNQEITKMLKETPFQNGWDDQLRRFEGAEDYRKPNGEKHKVRFAGPPDARDQGETVGPP